MNAPSTNMIRSPLSNLSTTSFDNSNANASNNLPSPLASKSKKARSTLPIPLSKPTSTSTKSSTNMNNNNNKNKLTSSSIKRKERRRETSSVILDGFSTVLIRSPDTPQTPQTPAMDLRVRGFSIDMDDDGDGDGDMVDVSLTNSVTSPSLSISQITTLQTPQPSQTPTPSLSKSQSKEEDEEDEKKSRALRRIARRKRAQVVDDGFTTILLMSPDTPGFSPSPTKNNGNADSSDSSGDSDDDDDDEVSVTVPAATTIGSGLFGGFFKGRKSSLSSTATAKAVEGHGISPVSLPQQDDKITASDQNPADDQLPASLPSSLPLQQPSLQQLVPAPHKMKDEYKNILPPTASIIVSAPFSYKIERRANMNMNGKPSVVIDNTASTSNASINSVVDAGIDDATVGVQGSSRTSRRETKDNYKSVAGGFKTRLDISGDGDDNIDDDYDGVDSSVFVNGDNYDKENYNPSSTTSTTTTNTNAITKNKAKNLQNLESSWVAKRVAAIEEAVSLVMKSIVDADADVDDSSIDNTAVLSSAIKSLPSSSSSSSTSPQSTQKPLTFNTPSPMDRGVHDIIVTPVHNRSMRRGVSSSGSNSSSSSSSGGRVKSGSRSGRGRTVAGGKGWREDEDDGIFNEERRLKKIGDVLLKEIGSATVAAEKEKEKKGKNHEAKLLISGGSNYKTQYSTPSPVSTPAPPSPAPAPSPKRASPSLSPIKINVAFSPILKNKNYNTPTVNHNNNLISSNENKSKAQPAPSHVKFARLATPPSIRKIVAAKHEAIVRDAKRRLGLSHQTNDNENISTSTKTKMKIGGYVGFVTALNVLYTVIALVIVMAVLCYTPQFPLSLTSSATKYDNNVVTLAIPPSTTTRSSFSSSTSKAINNIDIDFDKAGLTYTQPSEIYNDLTFATSFDGESSDGLIKLLSPSRWFKKSWGGKTTSMKKTRAEGARRKSEMDELNRERVHVIENNKSVTIWRPNNTSTTIMNNIRVKLRNVWYNEDTRTTLIKNVVYAVITAVVTSGLTGVTGSSLFLSKVVGRLPLPVSPLAPALGLSGRVGKAWKVLKVAVLKR